MANAVARHLRKTMTAQEIRLWSRLRLLRHEGHHFRRQVPIDDFIVDFACYDARLIVEVDGGQHARHARLVRDAARDRLLKASGPHLAILE